MTERKEKAANERVTSQREAEVGEWRRSKRERIFQLQTGSPETARASSYTRARTSAEASPSASPPPGVRRKTLKVSVPKPVRPQQPSGQYSPAWAVHAEPLIPPGQAPQYHTSKALCEGVASATGGTASGLPSPSVRRSPPASGVLLGE